MQAPEIAYPVTDCYLGCFQFLAVMNKAAINILDSLLCGHKFSQELGKHLGAQLPDHMAQL